MFEFFFLQMYDISVETKKVNAYNYRFDCNLLNLISLECYVISTSAVNHHLENLTPGAKYNISLTGVTKAGEGPRAVLIINTLPENPVNGNNSQLHCWRVFFSPHSMTTFPYCCELPFPFSADVGPELAVCDVFNLNLVHLHAETVGDLSNKGLEYILHIYPLSFHKLSPLF